MEKKKFTVSLFMIFLIGAMNSYTYFLRGEVFASMHTGNIIKACFDMAKGEFALLYKYAIPIVAFITGIMSHYFIIKAQKGTLFCSLLICASYIGGIFIPRGALDFLAVALLSFGVGIQLQLIRRVNGVDLATTMCTGNMRSMTERLAKYIDTRDKALLIGIFTYLSLILVFAIGVVLGAVIIFSL